MTDGFPAPGGAAHEIVDAVGSRGAGCERPHDRSRWARISTMTSAARPTVFVLNGPNLNLLGTREPAVYGRATLADVEKLCHDVADELGLSVDFRQSNHEGDLIDWIHEAGRGAADGSVLGVVINPGAYTHTSIALHDAIKLSAPLLRLAGGPRDRRRLRRRRLPVGGPRPVLRRQFGPLKAETPRASLGALHAQG